ncbi:MAG: FKBP-type peptidyl-prolyl cis-trans isomerase [Pirellulales bacterium]
MNRRLILAASIVLIASPIWSQERGGRVGDLKTLREKASYSFGMSMGHTLKKQGIDIDVALLVQGIRDATSGKTLLTEEQALEAMQAFEKEMVARQAEDSKRFMSDNKRRPGIKATASGLQYKVLKAGTGPRPKATDVVRVNYRASFTNGVEFEKNSEVPFTTPVNQVIPGWQEALQLMEVGSKWQVFIPPDLAYGEQGSPPAIGPNTALVFELELLEIAKPASGANRKTAPPTVR